jgi:hypothetical protein
MRAPLARDPSLAPRPDSPTALRLARFSLERMARHGPLPFEKRCSMPQAVLPFAFDLIRAFLVAQVARGDPRGTQPVQALVGALPPASAASLPDMRLLLNEIIRGRLQAFSSDRVLLERDGSIAIPLLFLARTALDHDGSASWSADEWEADVRRSPLWRLTLLGDSSSDLF